MQHGQKGLLKFAAKRTDRLQQAIDFCQLKEAPKGLPLLLVLLVGYNDNEGWNLDAPPEAQKRQQARQALHSWVTETVRLDGTSTETSGAGAGAGATSGPVTNDWLTGVPMTAPLTSRRDTSAV